jgi:hypothetical protein
MAQKPIDQKTKARFVELVALDLSQAEAARAVGIGQTSGER